MELLFYITWRGFTLHEKYCKTLPVQNSNGVGLGFSVDGERSTVAIIGVCVCDRER